MSSLPLQHLLKRPCFQVPQICLKSFENKTCLLLLMHVPWGQPEVLEKQVCTLNSGLRHLLGRSTCLFPWGVPAFSVTDYGREVCHLHSARIPGELFLEASCGSCYLIEPGDTSLVRTHAVEGRLHSELFNLGSVSILSPTQTGWSKVH